LFYRLDVFALKVPPLSERREDIPLLAAHFLAKHAPDKAQVPRLSPEAIEQLLEYEYPGNIRELENIIQRLLVRTAGDVISAARFDDEVRPVSVLPRRSGKRDWPSLVEQERRYILEVLDEVEGNRSKAAKILDIDRVSLWRKIKRYGLDDNSADTGE
jgi:DNA-binding NtrC family response regulator